MKDFIVIFVLAIVTAALIEGCASLVPGADPLVVRAEQLESGATNTLTLVVSLDDSNRQYWMTNAPAFHNFCETLRAPMVVDGITLPKGLAAVKQLDDVKLAYKAGTTTSNVFVTAITTASSILNQASAWITIATNAPPPITP